MFALESLQPSAVLTATASLVQSLVLTWLRLCVDGTACGKAFVMSLSSAARWLVLLQRTVAVINDLCLSERDRKLIGLSVRMLRYTLPFVILWTCHFSFRLYFWACHNKLYHTCSASETHGRDVNLLATLHELALCWRLSFPCLTWP